MDGTNLGVPSSNKANEAMMEAMNSVKAYSGTVRITILKYILNGRTNRVIIKSPEGNYFMDFSVHSFFERSFVNTLISIVKILSFISVLQIDVSKIIN